MIKKADIVLGVILVLLCLSSLFLFNLSDENGTVATITVDGKLYGSYDLSENRQIEIGDASHSHSFNIVEIRNGSVSMAESSCSNQICVQQGAINRVNQTIVCLPNKVVVSISGSQSDMDAVSY